MSKINLNKIKQSASMVAPIAPLALSFAAPNISNGINKVQTAVGAVGQVGGAVNNTLDSAKNARKNNPYHNKLSGIYNEKIAAEDTDGDNKKQKVKKTLAKIAPYATAGTLILAYGAQAVKDKSPTKPLKKAVAGVPAATVDQIKKKSDIVKGAISGAKKGVKEANKVTVVQHKKTPFESLVNGAAWGTGVLGAHMIGNAFFKNKTGDVAKSYEKSQPAVVKVVETAKEVKDMIDKNKNGNAEQEKTAAIKGAELLGKAKASVSKIVSDGTKKAIDAGVNPHKVWKDAVLLTAATAPLSFAGKEISNKLSQSIKNRAREDYLKRLNKRKSKAVESESESEKTAGAKDAVKHYIKEYGESGIKQLIKPTVSTIATVPLIYGAEWLNQKKKTKQIAARNAEREKQKEEDGNRGRNYEGSKRNAGPKHNLPVGEKGRIGENR